jgi:hypothetical protein
MTKPQVKYIRVDDTDYLVATDDKGQEIAFEVEIGK